MKKTVFITGVTGVMGKPSMEAILQRGDCKVRTLVRPGKKNRKLMARYVDNPDVKIIWGDLTDFSSVKEALGDATIVLHLGGMVSPAADRHPEQTMKVNVGGTSNIVKAIGQREDNDDVRLVYIGSVAQTSDRREPHHWGRTGDPVKASIFDYYGLSKIMAERVVAESGLRHWVSLRQSGILHPGLFMRGSDPITFHVPLRGVLEWTTLEDSARLMAALCSDSVPESFWRNFYNIGSGEDYRLTNYEFESIILSSIGSAPAEKIFEPSWFATRNFHGCWFADSDLLDRLVPFRHNIPIKEYFRNMVKKAPWWTRLAGIAPAPVVKRIMKKVAMTPDYGTLDWLGRDDCEDKIKAFFGSREEQAAIPGWDNVDKSRPSSTPLILSHGYDETKPDSEINVADLQEAARFRGGKLISDTVPREAMDAPLEWECAFGHRFRATPRLILKGGHWCPECLPEPWNYEEEAKVNPFLAQIDN